MSVIVLLFPSPVRFMRILLHITAQHQEQQVF
nr:MAG TPA: hypothetical protein [Caudoviricetes sp.]